MSAIVVDGSAVVAILAGEPAASELIEALDTASERLMPSPTLVELSIVLEARYGAEGALAVAAFERDAALAIVPVDRPLVDRAMDGWRRFGKGRHAAGLNLGDCFAYAVAAERGLPILCVGDDFAKTDVPVLPTRS